MKSGPLFYRIMLWSLGAAAACGVLAMLAASYHTLGRVSATAFATALAAGAAWALGEKLEAERLRSARVFGIGTAVVCYLLVLTGIWDIEFIEDESWGMAVSTALAGSVISGCLAARFLERARIAACTGIVISALAWLISMPGIWQHGQFEWLATSFAIACYGGITVLCLVNINREPTGGWRWVGIAASVGAWGIVVADIWDWIDITNAFEDAIVVLTSVGLVALHANLSLLIRLRDSQRWIRVGTIGAAILTAASTDFLVVTDISGDSLAGRLAGAAAIAMGCGTLALAILRRYNQATELRAPESTGETFTEITFTCPRCRTQQTVPFGDSSCASCGLGITIQIAVGEQSELPGAASASS